MEHDGKEHKVIQWLVDRGARHQGNGTYSVNHNGVSFSFDLSSVNPDLILFEVLRQVWVEGRKHGRVQKANELRKLINADNGDTY